MTIGISDPKILLNFVQNTDAPSQIFSLYFFNIRHIAVVYRPFLLGWNKQSSPSSTSM